MDELIKCVLLYCSIVKRGTKGKTVLFEDKIFIVNKNNMKMHKFLFSCTNASNYRSTFA